MIDEAGEVLDRVAIEPDNQQEMRLSIERLTEAIDLRLVLLDVDGVFSSSPARLGTR